MENKAPTNEGMPPPKRQAVGSNPAGSTTTVDHPFISGFRKYLEDNELRPEYALTMPTILMHYINSMESNDPPPDPKTDDSTQQLPTGPEAPPCSDCNGSGGWRTHGQFSGAGYIKELQRLLGEGDQRINELERENHILLEAAALAAETDRANRAEAMCERLKAAEDMAQEMAEVLAQIIEDAGWDEAEDEELSDISDGAGWSFEISVKDLRRAARVADRWLDFSKVQKLQTGSTIATTRPPTPTRRPAMPDIPTTYRQVNAVGAACAAGPWTSIEDDKPVPYETVLVLTKEYPAPMLAFMRWDGNWTFVTTAHATSLGTVTMYAEIQLPEVSQ
jgi:hypothetical protein